jgi:hypothetical protein
MPRHPIGPFFEEMEGGGGGGADLRNVLNRLIRRRAKPTGTATQLLVLVLANPEDEFGKSEIFGLREYWHHRSGADVIFLLPGYASDSKTGRLRYSAREFNQFIKWVESETTIRYASHAVLLLVAAKPTSGTWALDWSYTFEMRIEDLHKASLIKSVKSVFEGLIAIAREFPPDDAITVLKNSLLGAATERKVAKGLGSLVTFWIPQGTQDAASALVAARTHFRVLDVRRPPSP